MSQVIMKNLVKQLADKKGIDRTSFVGLCLSSRKTIDGRRLSAKTAERVYDGETGISLSTAALVAAALGVEVSEIFVIE